MRMTHAPEIDRREEPFQNGDAVTEVIAEA